MAPRLAFALMLSLTTGIAVAQPHRLILDTDFIQYDLDWPRYIEMFVSRVRAPLAKSPGG